MTEEICQECREETDCIYQCEKCNRRLCERCYGDITITICRECEKKEVRKWKEAMRK